MKGKGTGSVQVCSRPCHNTNTAGNRIRRANRHRHQSSQKPQITSIISTSGHYVKRCHPYPVPGDCNFSLHSFASLSLKTFMLPTEWCRLRECLIFYILSHLTSLCMHLSLLSEAYVDIKEKEKCCIRINGFSC